MKETWCHIITSQTSNRIQTLWTHDYVMLKFIILLLYVFFNQHVISCSKMSLGTLTLLCSKDFKVSPLKENEIKLQEIWMWHNKVKQIQEL